THCVLRYYVRSTHEHRVVIQAYDVLDGVPGHRLATRATVVDHMHVRDRQSVVDIRHHPSLENEGGREAAAPGCRLGRSTRVHRRHEVVASVTFPPIVLNSTSIVPVLLLTSTLPTTFAASMKVSPALSMTRACPPTVTPMSKPVVVCSAPPLTKKSPPRLDANWRHTQAEFWPMTLPAIWLAEARRLASARTSTLPVTTACL